MEKTYGDAAGVEEIRNALSEQRGIDGLLLQGCETSTGTSHDLESIGEMVRAEFPSVLIVVDGITSIGCETVRTDDWGLDIVVSGSQKAFAVPPGLAFLSLSPRAVAKMKTTHRRNYYFDLLEEIENQAQGKTSYTPLRCPWWPRSSRRLR